MCTLVCLKIRYQFVCYVGFAIVPQPSVNTTKVMHEVRLQCEAVELPLSESYLPLDIVQSVLGFTV